MQFTLDPLVDMAYLSLTEIEPGGVATTEALIVDLPAGRRLIDLDFDRNGRLLGIEFDGAASTVPKSLLSIGPATFQPSPTR